MSILEKIKSPSDIKDLDLLTLSELVSEVREEIINTVSKTGGHLASSLGVVELTVALLKVFDVERDKIIWDVGHQCYAYKILTRGVNKFRTLRQFGGISGFPKIKESKYDHFGTGHSSTSISAALGQAVARDLKGENFKVVAVIGDGAMSAGIAFEALNHAGDLGKDLIVILNDNEMSISKSVGALSSFLSRKFSKRSFQRFREEIKHLLHRVPHIGDELLKYLKRGEESLKVFFTPGILFEAFKFNYLGPIDGHNLKRLVQILEQVKYLKGPILIHVSTKKGKGFEPAEKNPTLFHGVGPFDPKTGEIKTETTGISYSKVLGKTLCMLAEKDKRIIAITAAMPEGTGLNEFKDLFPDRFFDVGICEQHAVTFAAGLATQGFKPVVCIYSTFLQRAYDQIIHDVCLQDLDVTFCLDRAGLVGEDGPTHHGQFDLSYLRIIPNMIVMAPKDEAEFQKMLKTAILYPHPTAIRYPRGSGPGAKLYSKDDIETIPIGKAETIIEGDYGLVIAVGSTVSICAEAIRELKDKKSWALLNARFIKPLPEKDLLFWIDKKNLKKIVIAEENTIMGGFGSSILEWLCEKGLMKDVSVKIIGLPDRFIEHGKPDELKRLVGLDKDSILRVLEEM